MTNFLFRAFFAAIVATLVQMDSHEALPNPINARQSIIEMAKNAMGIQKHLVACLVLEEASRSGGIN